MRGVISNYEKAYLSKSLARLFDTVNQNFVTIPTKTGLDAILRIIRAETLVEDPLLKRLMLRNISKTVHLLCVKSEQLVATDGSSTQVIGMWRASTFLSKMNLFELRNIERRFYTYYNYFVIFQVQRQIPRDLTLS